MPSTWTSLQRLLGIHAFARMPRSAARVAAPGALAHGANVVPLAASARPPRRPGLVDRLDRWRSTRQRRRLEAHVAGGVDVHDVEARLHAVERGTPHPYY